MSMGAQQKPNDGKVRVEIVSPNQQVKVSDDKGPALQSVQLVRGRMQGLQEIG